MPGNDSQGRSDMNGQVRVVVGEDSFLVRQGLVHALAADPRIDVVAAEGDLDAVRAAIERLGPDVVVTDIRMPPTGTDEGIRLATELRSSHPEIAVIVLSEHARRSYALTLFAGAAGRRGYLLKDRIADDRYLVDAVEAVAQGRPVLDPKIVELVVGSDEARANLDDLTSRELEVITLLAEGRSNGSIATELAITRRAVERHVNSIFEKLDLTESQAVNRRVLAALLFSRAVS